ncbi:probable BOI-related E3 ubiquitin-protein ligase 3 [Phalaenopsis equestris]|uniref:probable BOI-related E3 ubiquitin-protein ligase 3 n=1 Tax=Phalaenopsis equestris TaxID=78828 RepID=UPI0009E21419|nr:probable BOI-related E3 ubiquitin-protein ligase 3 [Phalaenopsis equestris]
MVVEAHQRLPYFPQLHFDREIIKVVDSQPPELGDAFISTAATVSMKRQGEALTFHRDDIFSYVHHNMLDLDRLLNDHNERVRLELAERRRLFTQQLMAAVEKGMLKQLKAKDYEIERANKINLELEQKVRSLSLEIQIWRELAQTNETNANVLRINLEQELIATQLRLKEQQRSCTESRAIVDDAESYCCGESDGMVSVFRPMRSCWSCTLEEATVLMLPCRHLCLCVDCGRGCNFCPVCKCSKAGSVNINLS